MDTLPTDLLTLLSIKLSPYEILSLNLKATDLDTKWFWYNYSKKTLDFEIMKLCKKVNRESLELLKMILRENSYKPGNEQIFQMMMFALKTGSDLLWDMLPDYTRGVHGNGLLSIVYTKAILYGRDNDMVGLYNLHPSMNTIAQRATNALKVDNMQLFEQIMEFAEITNVDNMKAIMLNPDHFDMHNIQLDYHERQLVLRWSIIINRLDIFINILDKIDDQDRDFGRLIECAMLSGSHEIVKYIFHMITSKFLFVQTAHDMGYYYRPFWDTVVLEEPLAIHSLKLFQPFDDNMLVVVGNSMDRVELDNIKMLFELAPPSKRELYQLIHLAEEHGRYDIYCYCWELLASD